jgi:hypothetical protein
MSADCALRFSRERSGVGIEDAVKQLNAMEGKFRTQEKENVGAWHTALRVCHPGLRPRG